MRLGYFAGLCVLFAPLLRADGNCQSMLQSFGGQAVPFTLTIHQNDHIVSYSSGAIPLGVYRTFNQYFSDRANNGQPFSATRPDRLGIQIDPNRSALNLTLESWNNGRSTTDLMCNAGSTVLRGNSINSDISLVLGGSVSAIPAALAAAPAPAGAPGRAAALATQISAPANRAIPDFKAPPPGGGRAGCGKCDGVDDVPILGSVSNDQLAASALESLKYLSRSDPDWIRRYMKQESSLTTSAQRLSYRVQATNFLARYISQ